MSLQSETVAHSELVSGGETDKHFHAGDIKSGTVAVSAGTFASVTFATAFVVIPNVVATIAFASIDKNINVGPMVRNTTVTGFEITYIHKSSGTVKLVDWIATDVGNP